MVAQAANAAVDAGVVVVSSSGNEAQPNQMTSPACASKVIGVGAVYDDDYPNCELPTLTELDFDICVDTRPSVDQLVCASNQSIALDVTAPGCVVFSADIDPGGASVVGLCGTSMASPHVAGLAALIIGLNPDLTPAEVRQAIRDGAVDLGPPGFDSGYGYGRIDVVGALLAAAPNPCVTAGDCDDGLFCTGVESCVEGLCQPGTPPACDDQVDCTEDSCDPGSDSCMSSENHFLCSDGNNCNGTETCDMFEGCLPGEPLDCDDGIDCTVDNCGNITGCTHIPDFVLCDNGNVCDGAETCHLTQGCLPGTPVVDGTPCPDGDVCNGNETCQSSSCAAGTPLPDADGDEVCDLIDLCPSVVDPDQLDTDDDGHGDACDCDPQRAEVWDLPGEALELRLSHGGGPGGSTNLVWLAPDDLGGFSVVYDTLRSEAAGDFGIAVSACVESDESDRFTADRVTPDPGQTLYFLIRPENDCGHGSLGQATLTGERSGRDCL
jgi:hypothetical protein